MLATGLAIFPILVCEAERNTPMRIFLQSWCVTLGFTHPVMDRRITNWPAVVLALLNPGPSHPGNQLDEADGFRGRSLGGIRARLFGWSFRSSGSLATAVGSPTASSAASPTASRSTLTVWSNGFFRAGVCFLQIIFFIVDRAVQCGM